MIQILGAAAVLVAAVGIGNELANQVRERLEALYQCKALIHLLQGQIRYAGSDMEEMLQESSSRLTGAFSGFCLRVAATVRAGTGREIGEIWQQEVEKALAESGLTREDRRQLGGVGVALGYLDSESQCRHLQNYLERLAPEIKRAEAETGQKVRLYRTLGIFAGLFTTILFL